jgi:hypothetical protein
VIYVTAAQVLAAAGVTSPTGDETTWATACAAAVNSGIETKLQGAVIVNPSAAYDELTLAAQLAGAEAYKRKEAAFGITGYADLNNAAIRVARDYLDGVKPLIARHSIPGIG